MGCETTYCRLCLDMVPAGDGQAIEEINKEMLQVLLINIDFNITENAVACSRCLNALQDCFDFKSTCVYADDYITPLVNSDVMVDNKKVFKKEIVSNDNGGMENFQVCQLCTSVIEDEVFDCTTDTDSKVGVLKDFNTDHELSVCKKCLSNTKKYNEFRKTCHKVEQRIKNYCQVVEGYGITNRVSLDDILKFNNAFTKPEAIKKECSDVEFTDVKLVCPENKDIVSIKCEEIHIKDEVDTGHMLTHGDSKVENKYKCEECPFRTKWRHNLKTHMVTHSSEYPYSCDECNYSSKRNSTLRVHKRIHQKNEEERYKCKLCSYRARTTKGIEAHMIRTHTDPSEVPKLKCAHCPYETAFKWRLTEHMRHMHDSEKQPMFKCKLCLYVTTVKANLRKHLFVHREATIQCNQCNYRTKQKRHLRIHMQRHEAGSLSSSKQLIFKCHQCEFSAHKKAYVSRHQLKHMEMGEAMVYYCAICDFKTKYKENLKSHLKGCLKKKKRKEMTPRKKLK